MIRSSIGIYLRYAVTATLMVLVPPLLVMTAVALTVRTATPLMLGALGAVTTAVVIAVAGGVWWRRRPESVDLSFGELMLWSFIRRWRAERRASQDAEVLGLDGKGRPGRRINLSAMERLSVLQDLATALETKDPYTHGHSTRVEHLAGLTASKLGLSDEECEELRLAASLHDVGKIRVPASILRKPARLTIDEKLVVQEHSAVGAWLVSDVSNSTVTSSVRHHHERWDGNGYPDGLSTTEIPLFARIIAVADAYDAMTSTRPYRPGLDRETALDEIKKKAGVQFDPAVVNAFVQVVPERSALAGLIALGGLGRLFRKTVAWGVRTGQAGVAPAVGAVGAASLVIGTMFSPPVAMTKPSMPPSPPGGGIVEQPGERVAHPTKARQAGKAPDVDRKAAPKDEPTTAPAEGDTAPPGRPQASDPNRVLGGILVRSPGSDGPAAGQGQAPASSPGESPPDGGPEGPIAGEDPPPGPPTARRPESPRTDPQPGRGRDCEGHPAQGMGPGNRRHCGT